LPRPPLATSPIANDGRTASLSARNNRKHHANGRTDEPVIRNVRSGNGIFVLLNPKRFETVAARSGPNASGSGVRCFLGERRGVSPTWNLRNV